MAVFTRVNGTAQPGAFYGLQPRFFNVALTGVHTGYTAVDSTFEKVVRGISTVASIVVLGTPASGNVVVAIDNSFGGRGSDSATATLAAAIDAATGGSSTVTEVVLSGNGLA
jgi:hypothetical protein